MQVVKQSEVSISDLVRELKEGKTVVYPTETCYGLGCDATNARAVERVFAIKQRQADKSVLIVVPDREMIREYVRWGPQLETICDRYWPGPLTAVVPLNHVGILAPGVIGPQQTIAFRITSHPLAAAVSRELGRPLVSTSANIAAQDSPYDIEQVLSMFEHAHVQPDIIIDAGPLPHYLPSTIVRVMDGRINVIRQGEIRL